MNTIPSTSRRYGTKEDKSKQDESKEQDKDQNKEAAKSAPPPKQDAPAELTRAEVENLIATSVKSALIEALPPELKKGVTEDGLKSILAAELAKHNKETPKSDGKAEGNEQAKTYSKSDFVTISENVVKAAFESVRRESKAVADVGDAKAAGGKSNVEVPVSWCKGNLPLHGKQLMNVLLQRPINDGISEDQVRGGVAKGEAILSKMRATGHMGKALTSTGSGTGDELVPTDLSSELQRRMYLSSDLFALVALGEIQQPTDPYQFPLSKTRPTFYGNSSEGSATTASDPGTGNITLQTAKFMAKTLFSYELDEDAIIPILPWLQGELALAAAETMESVILNGDTSGTHQDTDTAGITNAAEKFIKGLRKYALAVTALKKDLSSGGISDANLRSMKKALGRWGTNPDDLVLVCGVNGQNDLEGLAEVSTVDKFGQNATIITGRLPKWRGVPIVTSAKCREDLNASGVNDGVTTSKGSIILFNRREFMLGRRRDFTIETFRDIDTQQTKVVASFRRSFVPRETPAATTAQTVVVGYNYTA